MPYMPAPKRIPDEQVKGAILAWRGNVMGAADELGLQPKNLRKRLETMGIDLESLRGLMGAIGVAPTGPHRPLSTPKGPTVNEGGHGATSARGLFPARERTPKFRSVEQAAAEDIPEVRTRKPVRVKPAHQERLRQAKLDFAGRLRIETDETAILAAFIDAKLEEFLSEQLAPQKKKRGGDSE